MPESAPSPLVNESPTTTTFSVGFADAFVAEAGVIGPKGDSADSA
ncbi:MAG: hypothetical protein ACRDP6_22550 [Actinoallomurus sp.]